MEVEFGPLATGLLVGSINMEIILKTNMEINLKKRMVSINFVEEILRRLTGRRLAF